jgi:hypothetical protein
MAYTTVSEIRARLPLVTAEVRSDAEVQNFIDQATATVDGFLRGVYVLPLATPLDPLVAFVALDLACALTLQNVYGQDAPNDAGQPAALRARAAGILQAVKGREILLDHELLAAPGAPRLARAALSGRAEGGNLFRLDAEVAGGEED